MMALLTKGLHEDIKLTIAHQSSTLQGNILQMEKGQNYTSQTSGIKSYLIVTQTGHTINRRHERDSSGRDRGQQKTMTRQYHSLVRCVRCSDEHLQVNHRWNVHL